MDQSSVSAYSSHSHKAKFFRYLTLSLVLLVIVSMAGNILLKSNRTRAATAGPALSIDAANRHTISPDIYGMNFADPALAKELHLSVDRYGGNATTRYNWQNDTSNHASDWFFENIPNTNSNVSALPNGSASDQFVDKDRTAGAKTIMTMPLIGYTPKARATSCGFSVAKYGPQQKTDQWNPDCGNGVKPDGTNITGNDPLDTSMAITPAFDQGWVNHLTSLYGNAATGGVKFYEYDNETSLWQYTHRDVHPQATPYTELVNRTYQYGPVIKAADPTALLLGPSDWNFSPALQNGEYYLQQMAAYQQQHGVRILDYFDNHYYPQEANVGSSAVDPATSALRLRSTRALWDPTYVDESWVNTNIMLIPRFKGWINKDYPGTKLAITEYNWGALDQLNGALTQADVLGIFGREGLDLATIWGPPTATQPGAYSFRIYRNYDGMGSMYGDQGVLSTSADQSQLSIYGAVRSSDNALTVVVINKTGNDLNSNIALANFTPGASAKAFLYSGANLNAIVPQAAVPTTASGLNATFPANSIMLFVIPAGTTGSTATATATKPASTATATATKPAGTATATATKMPGTATATATKPASTATATVIPSPTATKPAATPTPTQPSSSGVSLKAQYAVGDPSAPLDNQIKPHLRIVNTGNTTVNLSDVTVRYWYTEDGTQAQSYWCDYASLGCSNISGKFSAVVPARTGADTYLQVGFTSGAGTLAPGANTNEIQNRAAKSDWSNYNENNDYSYNGTMTSYTDWNKVTVYYKGLLVWGIEP